MRALVPRMLTVTAVLTLLGPAVWPAEDPPGTDQPQADAPREEKPKGAPPVVTIGKDGFSVRSEEGGLKLNLNVVVQADGRFYLSDPYSDGTNTFVLRRVRPSVSGTVGRDFDFNVTPDFGGGTAVVQDAYLGARFNRAIGLKAGKFKSPVGLERLQLEAGLTFVERGLPTDIVPDRDVGVEIHGEIAGGVVDYQAGIFNGAVDGGSTDAGNNNGKDLEGRLFLQPFEHSASAALKGLGFGIAGTNGRQLGPVPTYKTIGQLTLFSYAQGVTADGDRSRLAPQASYQSGPFRAFGEWVRSRQALRKSPTNALTVQNMAWQGAVSLVLTGEAPGVRGVAPKREFRHSEGGWGAVELAARYGRLDIDRGVFPAGYADPAKSARTAKAWGVGVNWYLTSNVKYVVNYDRTTFVGGAPAGRNRNSENALLFRAQLSF